MFALIAITTIEPSRARTCWEGIGSFPGMLCILGSVRTYLFLFAVGRATDSQPDRGRDRRACVCGGDGYVLVLRVHAARCVHLVAGTFRRDTHGGNVGHDETVDERRQHRGLSREARCLFTRMPDDSSDSIFLWAGNAT